MAKQLFHIVPMRFLIDETYLRDFAVSVLQFPYQQACTDFVEDMKQLHLNGKEEMENPPYRRLNTVLTAMAPTLAHAFEYQRNTDTGQYERQMLVVGTDVSNRPTLEQISDVANEWGIQWAQDRFTQEISGAGRYAHQRLLDRLKQPAHDWREVDAASLLLNLNTGTRLGFHAIPSIIATLLVQESARKPPIINGRTITWRLVQDNSNGNGLAVVSNPFTSRYQDPVSKEVKEGTFAYKLEFRLQTQVGSSHHWLHLYVRCRRYVDAPIVDVNWRRDVSVSVGIEQPRLTGWSQSSTLITLPLTGGPKNPRWLDDPALLLSSMQARNLVSPEDILKNPPLYRKASPASNYDEYYVVHAEGFKPPHDVKTGFDFTELREVATAVGNILGLELSCGQTLAPDEPAYHTRLKRPLIMYKISDVHEKQFVKKTFDYTKQENQRQNQLARQQLIVQALQRATGGQAVSILLFWYNDVTRKTQKQEVHRALFLGEHDPWPAGIEVIEAPTPIPATLLAPLDSGSLNPQDHYKKNATYAERKKFQKLWRDQMRRAFRDKTKAWEDYLRSIMPASQSYRLVLIELRPFDVKQYHYTQNIKGAVRRACNKLGLASQMMHPMKQNKEGEVSTASQYRARNAITDLIYRQTGLVYDQPVDLYIQAGIPQELAAQLHVVTLYNLRAVKQKVNYPMAVRLCPNGQLQVLLPRHSHEWLPFLDARTALGEVFARWKQQDIVLSPEEHTQFAAHIFTRAGTEPTLVLLDAVDWRNYNVLPQFANINKLENQLDLGDVKGFNHIYTPDELPNLRILRLRTVGTSGETPQYFTAVDEDWDSLDASKDLSYLAGFVDTQPGSNFFHYLSIGQLPKTAKQQQQNPGVYKTDEGGGIAFKHQTIVEFVPFFLQTGDDPLTWCRIPHFLRIAPAWDGGNIVLPYPMHLAERTIDDQLCILENDGDWEEA